MAANAIFRDAWRWQSSAWPRIFSMENVRASALTTLSSPCKTPSSVVSPPLYMISCGWISYPLSVGPDLSCLLQVLKKLREAGFQGIFGPDDAQFALLDQLLQQGRAVAKLIGGAQDVGADGRRKKLFRLMA